MTISPNSGTPQDRGSTTQKRLPVAGAGGRREGDPRQPQTSTWLTQAQQPLLRAGLRKPERTPSPRPSGPTSSPRQPTGGPVPQPQSVGSSRSRHRTPPHFSLPAANPGQRNKASGRPLSGPSECSTPVGADLTSSDFGWQRIEVLIASLSEEARLSYLARWERELRTGLPVYMQ